MNSDSQNLKLLHDHQLALLKYLIKVADDNKIHYLLIGGTLLGAVRHNGFIPWDDDVDVGFTRENFKKIISVLKNKKDNQFGVFEPDNLNYPFAFGRLYDKQLEFTGPAGKENVFIDLIPLDERPKYFRNFWLYNRMIIIKDGFFGSSNFVKKIGNLPIVLLAKIIPRKNLINFRNKITTEIAPDQYLYNWSSPYLLKEKYNKQNLDQFIKNKFENLTVNIPKNYQEILEQQYGDWKKIPEKSEQRTHFPLESIKIVSNDK